MTKLSKQMLDVIRASDKHMTAEEIYTDCQNAGISVSVASVYRILTKMVDEGYLRRVTISGEPDRFDKTIYPHEHILCDRCRTLRDIDLGDIRRLLERRAGETLTGYDLCLHYICPACLAAEKK